VSMELARDVLLRRQTGERAAMDTRRTDLREAIERLYEMTTLEQTDSSEFEQLDHFIQQRLLDTYADVPDVALRVVA
jgi:hypothetical protein